MSRNTKDRLYNKIIIRYKKAVAIGMVLVFAGLCAMPVSASTLSKAKNAKNEAENNLNAENQKISGLQSQKTELQKEMNALDTELSQVLVDLAILEDEIVAKKAELEEVNQQLVEATQKAQQEYDGMKIRIQFMYENGDTSFMQSLLESQNIADFVNRVEYVDSMYTYDRNLLTQYQETQQQVQELQIQVQGEEAELEEIQASYEEQEASLQAMIAQKQGEMADFNTQLENAKTLAAQYAATIEEQNNIIREEQRKQQEAILAAQAAKKKQSSKNNTNNTDTSTNATAENQTIMTGTTAGATAATSGQETQTTDKSSQSGANPSYKTGVSGGDVASYAMQFVGNPYVSGGTSLTEGADCSGYVMSVYSHFGISLPHSSAALAGCGQEVSYENAQPGDIVCYTGHVGIYIGNGQIVNASSSKPYPVGGIKTNSATYRTITTIRRVL
ncbi:MAG: NlpC/P60 family protein [Lachnospiraceae bacterium]|nr:NlpC/P60 family protein [Lachnospiraceae bacterium]